jgi:hypothetical protein
LNWAVRVAVGRVRRQFRNDHRRRVAGVQGQVVRCPTQDQLLAALAAEMDDL